MNLRVLALTVLPLASAGCDKDNKSGKKSGPDPTPLAPPPATSAWRVTELLSNWELHGFLEDKDLSGMAAWDDRHCLICTDEKSSIQSGTISRAPKLDRVTAGAPFPLLPGAGKKTETDTEGVAVSHPDGCYYVTGSHGVAKKSGELQPSRCHVFRIPVDAATGEPQPDKVQAGSLLPWVKQNPVLAPFVEKDLQHDGFNIEGLAYKDGKLWFGVRAPNIDGDVFVIEAVPASLFGNAPEATLHRLKIGAGLGIREIVALRNDFLFVAGEANSAAGPDNEFRLFRWKPGKEPEYAGTLPTAAGKSVSYDSGTDRWVTGTSPAVEGKAEGLYVLEETADHVDVLVIFDSAPNGGPHAYRIARP